ncbi:MAG: hypothetical protein N2745_08375 [Syntrophorhabdaceae bacterium]|nr:hypothetical protein [Syntrophorhabdaceae bacterium]
MAYKLDGVYYCLSIPLILRIREKGRIPRVNKAIMAMQKEGKACLFLEKIMKTSASGKKTHG